jgi:PAS domain S-box-containing protein
MNNKQSKNTLQFLAGGGEMGELTRTKDWSKTPIGNPETWPQSLRTALSIVLNSKFPMFLFWGSKLTCFYNDAYRPSLGQNGKHPDILGMDGEEAWPEIWSIIKPLIDQVLSGGEGTWSEDQLIPIYRNDKLEDVYWTFSYSPINDENGPAGVFVTCSETTEKVNTLKNLAESEERFRNLAESSDILIAVADETGNATYFNKAWIELLGRPMQDLLNFGWPDLIHPEDQKPYVNIYLSAFEKREHFTGEFRVMGAEGAYHCILAKGSPRFHSDGSFAGYISSCIDITASKETNKQLRESEQRFKNVANNVPMMLWMADADRQCYYFNSQWLSFTGRTLEQELGSGWRQSIHPDDLNRCLETCKTAFENQRPFYMEYRLKRHDGEYRLISDKGAPNFTTDGVFSGYVGACMDIHENALSQKKIQESEEKLGVIIEASGQGTWELNFKTREVHYSERYLEILGFPKDSQPKHEELLKRLHPDDIPIREKAIAKALETGFLHYQSRLIHDDKSIHWQEGRGKVLYNESNEPIKMIGTIRDITAERNHETELLERELKFRVLADSLPQHIWTADTEGNLNYYNRSVYSYSGFSPEQLTKVGWLDMVHPDDRDSNIKAWTHAISTGSDFLFEHRFRRHDGEYRWQLSRAIPQRGTDNAIQMWVGTSTDIQDQKMFTHELEKQVEKRTRQLKELNESLVKSEERYHLMVEEVQDYAILYLNREGTVENWNKGAEKIKGYRTDEIVGKNFSQFYTDKDRKENLPQTLLKKAVDTGRAVQEGWRVRKNGTLFWASVVITAVHNEAGEVIGFSKVTHDLTEKKAADDKISQNAAQLEQKNEELEKMNKELESFAYISSHDLQEPLRKIQTFASRIAEKEYESLSENARDNFQRMQFAAKRMQVLIEDLLAYSRTSNTERKYTKSNLRKIVEEVKEDLSEEIGQKKAVVEMSEMCEAKIIPFQFRQLIQNLISNSFKFAKEDEPAHVKIYSEIKPGEKLHNDNLLPGVDYCHVNVSDNGIGFEPQYSEKIFEVFQRLHGKTEYIGTGIGLAIVKKIVENHDGIITASSEIDNGATFDIYFPVRN